MNFTLKELLDIPRLRELLESLDEIHSMPSAIIDTEGTVLIATSWQDICTNFHRINPDTEKKCLESDRHIEARLGDSFRHVVYRCPMGLVDSAVPIIIEGKHLGNVFTGQLFLEPPDEEYFMKQARQYGFDESEYLAAMRKVSVFPEEKLHKKLNVIHNITQLLAEQGLQFKRQCETEETLRKSEQRSLAIIEASPVPLAMNDEHGNITFLNKAFVQTLGYTANDIPTLADWWPRAYPDPHYRKSVADKWQESMEEVKRTNRAFSPFEINIVCKDDAVRTFICSAAALEENFSGTHLVFLYDISGRQRAEEKLRKSEEKFRSIVETTAEWIWEMDLRVDSWEKVTESG